MAHKNDHHPALFQRLRSGPARRGFTLVELVSVIAILSIVGLAVAGPTISNLTGLRAGAAVARLASDIRYLQRTAMSSGLRTWLSVDAANERYTLYIEDRDNPGKASRLGLPHPLDQSTSAVQFNSSPYIGVLITSASFNGTTELEFDNFGSPRDANASLLTSIGLVQLSNSVAVRVHPVGGFVEHRKWP